MKKIKKLGVVAIAFAMCMLLGITVWAAGDSTFSYTVQPETSQMCVSNEARTVTLTVQANKPLDVSSIGATIVVSGCELESVSVPGSILGAEDFAWVSGDAGNRSTQELIVIKVTVPAGTGTYSVEVKDVLLTQWTDTIETLTSLTTTAKAEIAVVDHDYAVTYNFAEDGSSCTANGVCKYDAAHTVTATATITSEQTKAPTCEVMGKTKYTATFTEAWAKTQTKTLTNVPALDHAWGDPSYTDNEDGTHTANYVCGNDESHTKSDAPVAHTYNQEGDKCVCGAEKPGLKGDFDLDGDLDADDLTAFARHVAGIESVPESALRYVDLDGSGEVDADDITTLARYIAGIITEWPENG